VSAGTVAAKTSERPPGELREAVRQTLTAEPIFARLDANARRAIAHSLVRIAHAARLLEDAAAMPAHAQTRAPPTGRAMSASDELGGRAVASMAGTTRNMINAISFPRFVNELITGVFKAMVETNQQQLQQYVELVRGVSQSLDGFAALGGGSDDMAKRWLAEQFPQSFAIETPDPADMPDLGDEAQSLQLITLGPAPLPDALRAALSLEPGEEVPGGSGPELFAFVRRSLARNRQQVLATMIQMGMQRIVVDSGRINAAMKFHIDATSAAAEQRHTGFDTRTTIGASGSVGFGWWSASASVSSTIGYVSTTDTQTREDVNAAADLTSSVELHFRTDQVPLDRLASQQTVQRLHLNTLNPERELQIAAETDRARISANQTLETARAARPQTPFAPTPSPAPAAPALDPMVVASRAGLPASAGGGARPAASATTGTSTGKGAGAATGSTPLTTGAAPGEGGTPAGSHPGPPNSAPTNASTSPGAASGAGSVPPSGTPTVVGSGAVAGATSASAATMLPKVGAALSSQIAPAAHHWKPTPSGRRAVRLSGTVYCHKRPCGT
jgi:hypothetical protein